MAVSHACWTHSVYRSTTSSSRSHESTTSTVPAVRALSSFALSNAVELRPPSLRCVVDSCAPEGSGRTAPVRTLNVTALWSGCYSSDHLPSSALSSERAPSRPPYFARDGPLYFERRDIPFVGTCNLHRESQSSVPLARSLPHHTLHALTSPQDDFVRPELRADPLHAVEVWADRLVALEVDRHDANSAVPGRDYSSSDVFVDECLIFLDVHVTVGLGWRLYGSGTRATVDDPTAGVPLSSPVAHVGLLD
ncbi:hypothetical protein EVAR_90444_1 [Eumeta japonica]|uniref:Uncharacterized protein n=1 Tax=Eumeta variegata TaxID=151549 RepID=A0A4C1SHJ7_EUMVA|nr:hypothetical protein EVAR_90444_1 [Eumeta japonica]